MVKFTFLFALLGLVFGSNPAVAEPSNAHQEESSKFKPGDFIMHHIADAHEIHFFTLNEGTSAEKHFSIYLPIIVKTEAGWEIFSSSHFYHNQRSIKTPKGHEHYYANPEHKMVMFHEKIYTSQDGSLKIDAEGHEIQVLEGANRLLADFKPGIIYENIAGSQGDNFPVAQFLTDKGYNLFRYRPYLQELIPLDSIDDLQGNLNIIALPKDEL